MPQESSEFIDAADEDELESVEGLRESQENVVGDAPVSDGYVGGFVEGAREIRAAVADQIQASAEGAKTEPARGDLVEVEIKGPTLTRLGSMFSARSWRASLAGSLQSP